MKIGNVAFTCIRLHGATTSICVWERGEREGTVACMWHATKQSCTENSLVSSMVNFLCNAATNWATVESHAHPHAHTLTQVEEHSHSDTHIQTYIQADTFIELQSDGNNDTDNESCSNMCPLWVATSLLLLLCRQQQWRNQLASTARRGTPFKVAPAGNKRTSN